MILTTNKYTLKTDEFFLSYHDFGYEINFCELNNCDVSNKFEKKCENYTDGLKWAKNWVDVLDRLHLMSFLNI